MTGNFDTGLENDSDVVLSVSEFYAQEEEDFNLWSGYDYYDYWYEKYVLGIS